MSGHIGSGVTVAIEPLALVHHLMTLTDRGPGGSATTLEAYRAGANAVIELRYPEPVDDQIMTTNRDTAVWPILAANGVTVAVVEADPLSLQSSYPPPRNPMSRASRPELLVQFSVACILWSVLPTDGPRWISILLGMAGAMVILLNRGLPKLMETQTDRLGLIMGVGLGLGLPMLWPEHALLGVLATTVIIPIHFSWGLSRTVLLVAAITGPFIAQQSELSGTLEIIIAACFFALWSSRERERRAAENEQEQEAQVEQVRAERESLNRIEGHRPTQDKLLLQYRRGSQRSSDPDALAAR